MAWRRELGMAEQPRARTTGASLLVHRPCVNIRNAHNIRQLYELTQILMKTTNHNILIK